MFFNPLFIDTNSTGLVQGQMNSKLGKSQYLFSDIIKISLSQSESAEAESTPLYNLSLVNDSGSISSLFNTAGTAAAKETAGSDTGVQNPEAMLIEFLQYAFVNQNAQGTSAINLQELMKDKELLLSKDSITNALSQLLQVYQPTVANNCATASANSTGSETVSTENLASQILASLDDKGKVVLNFQNALSQIKIELTKLNNEEKELFISTKIIPMAAADAAKKAENTKVQADSKTTSQQTIPVQTINKEALRGKVTSDVAAQLQQIQQQAESSDTVYSNPQAAADTTDIMVKQKAVVDINNVSKKSKQAKSGQINSESTTIASDDQSLSTDEKTVIPITSELEQKAGTAKPVTGSVKTTTINIPVVNSTDEGTDDAKSVPVAQKSSTQPEITTENENKSNEYKLRVVEITSDKTEKTQDAKIFSMTQFEKNLIKKSNITYTSTAAGTKKQADTSADIAKTVSSADTANESITTISQADEKILKTNNMLFDDNTEVKQTIQTGKTDTTVVADTKAETVKKTSVSDILKTTAGLKNEKADSSSKKINLTDLKQTKTDDVKNTVTVKDISSDKNKKIDISDPVQAKQTIDKTSKQTVVNDESAAKSLDANNSASETTDGSGKKAITNSENTSFKQSMESEQKDANSQNSSEKKGSESKQTIIQNVSDKEKVFTSKNEIVKDLGKQSDVTKTVKTYEIIKEIKSFVEQGTKSTLMLNIEPENLGSVKISLDMAQNMVQARIDVDNESVKQFVQTNLESLKQSLSQSGVNLSNVQVNVSSSDQRQQKNVSPYKRRMSGKTEEGSYEEVDETGSKKILGYNSYDYLA